MGLHDISGADLAWKDLQPVGVRVEVPPFQAESANTNWSSLFPPGTLAGQALPTRESTGVQNAEVTFKVALAAGTWKLYLLTYTLPSAGIYTIRIDGVSQGTIDGYSAGNTVNVLKTLTGMIVVSSGLHDLNFKMETKNGSSSNYYGDLQSVILERTA